MRFFKDIFGVSKRDAEEEEKMARLEQAERELEHVKTRSDRATRILSDRGTRNHWRESIEQMIQGA